MNIMLAPCYSRRLNNNTIPHSHRHLTYIHDSLGQAFNVVLRIQQLPKCSHSQALLQLNLKEGYHKGKLLLLSSVHAGTDARAQRHGEMLRRKPAKHVYCISHSCHVD